MSPQADFSVPFLDVYIMPRSGPLRVYLGTVMNMAATETPAPRRGRRPSGVPHKPNVAVILHNRLWKALDVYGDGSPVRGLERATAEACRLIYHRKDLDAADSDVVSEASRLAQGVERILEELPAPA